MPADPHRLFKLSLDPPHSFAVEQGYIRNQNCTDFNTAETGSLDGTMQDPLTGLVMLEPSFVTESWYDQSFWEPLSSWVLPSGSAGFWQAVFRGAATGFSGSLPLFLTTLAIEAVSGGGLVPNLITVTQAIISLQSAISSDVLVWALESSFTLAADEGFVWHYRTMTDEHHRPRNWFALGWSDILIHFSTDGHMRTYQYTAGLTSAPTLIDEHLMFSPSEVLNKEGYFVFMPIPGHGIAVYHPNTPQNVHSRNTSNFFGSARGHVIPVEPLVPAGGAMVTNASTMVVGLAGSLILMQHTIGFHRIRYGSHRSDGTPIMPGDTAAYGLFNDNTFHPGYEPSGAPADVEVGLQDSLSKTAGTTTAATTLRKGDLSGGWVHGTDKVGRITALLHTTDRRYTPLVASTQVIWLPVFATRDTTAVNPRLMHLQMSEDCMSRFEGSAVVMATSAEEMAVCERGDMSYDISSSTDNGATFTHYAGGIARVAGDIEVVFTQSGMHYIVNLDLFDMFYRFAEVGQLEMSAYDNLDLNTAMARVLASCALPGLASTPSALTAITLPQLPTGQTWRMSPRVGTRGDDLIRNFLLFARTQSDEWRLRFDWTANNFVPEKRVSVDTITPAWTITPYRDEVTTGANAPRYDTTNHKFLATLEGSGDVAFRFSVQPPECNILQPYGLTDTNANTASRQTIQPFVNTPSLVDNTSVDYLGRIVAAYPMLSGIDKPGTLVNIARELERNVMHRRLLPVITTRDYIPGFGPDSYVGVIRGDVKGTRGDHFTALWCKRRITTIDYTNGDESTMVVTYHLDSIWSESVE